MLLRDAQLCKRKTGKLLSCEAHFCVKERPQDPQSKPELKAQLGHRLYGNRCEGSIGRHLKYDYQNHCDNTQHSDGKRCKDPSLMQTILDDQYHPSVMLACEPTGGYLNQNIEKHDIKRHYGAHARTHLPPPPHRTSPQYAA